MPYQREFVCYTHPSQFQDKQHRKQVKSYVSTRAYWIERRTRLSINHSISSETHRKRAHEPQQGPGEEDCPLGFVNYPAQNHTLSEKRSTTTVGEQSNPTSTRHTVLKENKSALDKSRNGKSHALLATMPLPPIDTLPGILHRQSQGFAAANEFYLEAVDANYTPIFHIFDVVNILGNNYHRQMQEEDALHAGVAAMQVIRGTFLSSFSRNGLSEEVLRFVQIAISKLRGRIARRDYCNDDATIMTVLFLAHLAMVFRDMSAFRMHRRAIKDMVQSRGGLERLNQDLWVKPSVKQFETWWSQLHGDPMFAEHKVARLVFYPKLPFTAEMRKIVEKIPSGFQKLARNGTFSMEMVILLGRISHYQKLGQSHKSLLSGVLFGNITSPRRHNDFDEACPSLSTPGPNFEKYLSFALLLYCSITFSPRRPLLEACHLVFGIPRSLLTEELALFSVKSPDEIKCFAWMWLVLIDAWIVANRMRSVSGTSLSLQLVKRYPELRAWTKVKDILEEFSSSEVVSESLHRHWDDLKLEDAQV